MDYYALQVRTGSENAFVKADSLLNKTGKDYSIIFPQRLLKIRKAGLVKHKLAPIFPGYVFLEIDSLDVSVYRHLKSLKWFYKFLPNNKMPKPLEGKDLAVLKHFLMFGKMVGFSKVFFDENDRIQVLEGPLKGLEGLVVKVDKRKGRARIKIDMASDWFSVDLAFEQIEPAKKHKY